MKSRFFCKQQVIYIALAIISMCFAGASLVLAHEDHPHGQELAQNEPTTSLMVDADASVGIEARSGAGPESVTMEERRAAREERMEERRADLDEKRAEIDARKAARRAALSEQMQQRVSQMAANAASRLEAAIVKMEGFIGRIEVRAEAFASAGADVSEAEAALAEARVSIEGAKTALTGIDVDIEFVITSDMPRQDWTNARAQFEEVHRHLKAAHEALLSAIRSLKAVQANERTD